jgi:uncharacterized protein (TIGR02271 family)
MTNLEEWTNVIGTTAIDADGEKVGKVGQIYLNDASGEPEWATVSTGLFGNRESFAPLYNARPGDGQVQLAVTKQLIKDAPNIDTDGHLDGSDVDTLYEYYSGYLGGNSQAGTNVASDGTYIAEDAATPDAGTRTTGEEVYEPGVSTSGSEYAGRDTAAEGYDTSGRTTDDAMTRSEERLHVGTESVQAGRARLRKYVVTENVTQTVPVSHEEVRVEREPITDANVDSAVGGAEITEAEHEVTLNAERPVVQKETVPVERVRLGTETVTEQHEVNEQIRKEQIEEPDVDGTLPRDERNS